MRVRDKNLIKPLLLILILQLGLAAEAISQSGKQGTETDQVTVFERTLSELEQTIFHRQYNSELIPTRVVRLEKSIFGERKSGSLPHRIDALIIHESDHLPASDEKPDSSVYIKQSTPPVVNKHTPSNKQSTATEADKQMALTKRAIEQISWETSSIIDQLLQGEESADSIALDEAMSKLDKMPPVNSNFSPEQIKTATMYRERGVAAYGQGKFVDAVSDFKQAQSLNPFDATILNDLVSSLIKINDLKTAVLYGPVAVSVMPSSTIAWCNMAEIFARAKQYSRAKGCVYLACLMSSNADQILSTIQEIISDIDQPEVRAPFRQGLFIAQYTLKDFDKTGDIGQAKYIGPDSDTALYKANMLLLFAAGLQPIKPKSGIVLVLTVSSSGQIIKTELLRPSGDPELDKSVMKAVADLKLPPLPKSGSGDKQQFIVPVDKVFLALADAKQN